MTNAQKLALQKLANNQSKAVDFETALSYLIKAGFTKEDAEIVYDRFYNIVKSYKAEGLMLDVKQPKARK